MIRFRETTGIGALSQIFCTFVPTHNKKNFGFGRISAIEFCFEIILCEKDIYYYIFYKASKTLPTIRYPFGHRHLQYIVVAISKGRQCDSLLNNFRCVVEMNDCNNKMNINISDMNTFAWHLKKKRKMLEF